MVSLMVRTASFVFLKFPFVCQIFPACLTLNRPLWPLSIVRIEFLLNCLAFQRRNKMVDLLPWNPEGALEH